MKFILTIVIILKIDNLYPEEKISKKSEQVLDFSAGVIEGELNRPSILMELGSGFKDFNDLIFLRDDFNSYQKIDSQVRFRYIEECK